MSDWLLLLLATVSGVALVGLSISAAKALGIVDRPGEIKIHSHVMPRFGGSGIVAAVLLWGVISGSLRGLDLLGLLIIALTGGLDDKYSLSPKLRLGLELVAGVLLGLHFWGSLGVWGLLLGIILVPLLCNAVNLTDGMNGLASGNALISAVGLGLLLTVLGSGSQLAVILVGAILGFLYWNFPQAKTFMGDAGSLSLGYGLALLLMHLAGYGLPALIAGLIMVGFPLFDLGVGILRRWRRGKPLFLGDRDHVYDRMNTYLKNPVTTVVLVWGVSLVLVLLGWMAHGLGLLPVILLVVLLLALALWGSRQLGSL